MKHLMNLPALLSETDLSFADRAKEAGTMVVLGILMVFAVLAIIMIVLMIMERAFAAKPKNSESTAKAAPQKPAPKAKPAPAPKVQPAPAVQTARDDGAVIAAITAAISAMLAAENGDTTYQGGFRVVSFKRSNRGTPWNSAR